MGPEPPTQGKPQKSCVVCLLCMYWGAWEGGVFLSNSHAITVTLGPTAHIACSHMMFTWPPLSGHKRRS